ncbi:MAG: M20/M25/M40 family metallo-hydrolase [Cyclobacteriaceae bacterium]|nr:M20/M25/M40 family metallo-hydrolase [Cyclobacteriaceae bacterium]
MRLLHLLLISIITIPCYAQNHETTIRAVFDEALENGDSYSMLEDLCLNIGHRLSGSPQAALAVEWSKRKMIDYGFDTVFLQPVMVPHWIRGKEEKAKILNAKTIGSKEVNVIALGNSIGTGENGITGKLLEIKEISDLEKIGKKNIEGKIVYFSRPFDQKHIRTFKAYGGAVDQRVFGPSEAAKYGAIGVVVRSMSSIQDDVPHTGTLRYKEEYPKIPAVAISTNDGDLLSKLLIDDKDLDFYFETHCEMLPDVLSHNVIGEIKGTEKPNEYIIVGGHLDSWDVGHGAHDDGAGCVQSIEALRIIKSLEIKPKHSIRAVMFMNEENGLRGGIKYAELALENNEKHVAAIESDAGGFSPKGFSYSGTESQIEKLNSYKNYFEPYYMFNFSSPGGGADIGALKNQGAAVIGLSPDSQRYFDLHHTTSDTFDKVNKRELELGAAAMASLIYLIDNEGF